jgi:hypothetical protein
MNETLDTLFRYTLGAEVTLKAMITPTQALMGRAAEVLVPQKLVVVERHLTECSGGHQQYYSCRVLQAENLRTMNTTRDLFKFQEEELMGYSEAVAMTMQTKGSQS